jgi:hypothetical protein
MTPSEEKDLLLSPTVSSSDAAKKASRSTVDGLFGKYNLPFLRQLSKRTTYVLGIYSDRQHLHPD